jgi:hypothetical protein
MVRGARTSDLWSWYHLIASLERAFHGILTLMQRRILLLLESWMWAVPAAIG